MQPEAEEARAPLAAGIARIVAHLEAAGVTDFGYEDGKRRLRLRLEPAAGSAPEVSSADPVAPRVITAPCPGIFTAAHPLRDAEEAEGAAIEPGAIVAFLRVGPCLRPVVAPEGGVVARRLVADGAVAGYGTALFELR